MIVGSSALVRAGLEHVLGADPGADVVGRTDDLAALPDEVAVLRPDVVLFDAPARDALTAFTLLADAMQSGAPALVMLVDDPSTLPSAPSIRAGLRAVLPRTASAEEIRAAVQAAASGLFVLSAASAEVLVPLKPPASGDAVPDAVSAEPLTRREVEVLRMIAAGLSNKHIAETLHISTHTAKFHVSAILTKLGVATRTEAVSLGIRHGLIPL